MAAKDKPKGMSIDYSAATRRDGCEYDQRGNLTLGLFANATASANGTGRNGYVLNAQMGEYLI